MGLGSKHNFFLLVGLQLCRRVNIVQKHDLVPVAVRVHSGLDCGVLVFHLVFKWPSKANK